MKKIPEEYRKYFYLGLTAVAAVWIFCIVFVVTYKLQAARPETTVSDISTATFPSAEAPSESSTLPSEAPSLSTEPAQTVSIDGNVISTSGEYSNPSWVDESLSIAESYSIKQSESVSASEAVEATRVTAPSGKENIVKMYVDAVNKLKGTSDFKLTKTNEEKIILDSVTGGKSVEAIIQKYIDAASDTTPKTFNFVGGNDSSTGSSPSKEIAPDGYPATLSADDVKAASVKKLSSGNFTITIELKDDRQTLDSLPKIYSSCMDIVDLNRMGLTSAMKAETMNIDYTGGKIIATLDTAGRITSMTHSLTIKKGAGTGKLTLISVAMEMHGSNKQTYNITY